MKTTRLAQKKLELIFPGPRQNQETTFLRNYIINKESKLNWNHGLTIFGLEEYCRRCSKYGIEIIGIEVYLASDYPALTFNLERYCPSKYNENWLAIPLLILDAHGITNHIIPIPDVPDSILNEFLF